jgi:homoserine O-acetyltransferase
MAAARKILKLSKPFEMRRGGVLPDVEIAYETWGDIGFCYDNAILIFTGLSPSAHAASSTEDPSPGWWEDMIGPGRPIDTRKYFVICVNSLGSPFGSTSPASINPATGQAYRLTFPVLTVEDMARAGHEVALSLGVRKAAAVIGPSLGGMTVLAYCATKRAVSYRFPRPRVPRPLRSHCVRCSGKSFVAIRNGWTATTTGNRFRYPACASLASSA